MLVYIWIIFNLSKVSLNFHKIDTEKFVCKFFFVCFFFFVMLGKVALFLPFFFMVVFGCKAPTDHSENKREKHIFPLMWRKQSGLILTALMMKYQCPHMIFMNVAFIISEKWKLHAIFSLGQYTFEDIKTCWIYQPHEQSTCKSA